MRSSSVLAQESLGKTLAEPVFSTSGAKLLPRGRTLSLADEALLLSEGINSVSVIEVDNNEVSESMILSEVCRRIAGGGLEALPMPGSRAEFYCIEPSVLLIERELMTRLNRSGVAVFASLEDLSFAGPGDTIAMVRARPLSAPIEPFQRLLSLLEQEGPPFQVKPIGRPSVASLFIDPRLPENARRLFEAPLKSRLAAYGVQAEARTSRDDEDLLAFQLQDLADSGFELVVAASTTAPADPTVPLGRAIQRIGTIEAFLAPIEPGSQLMIGAAGKMRIVAAPGCLRSRGGPNALDRVLPALLAGLSVADRICNLGEGGFKRGSVLRPKSRAAATMA